MGQTLACKGLRVCLFAFDAEQAETRDHNYSIVKVHFAFLRGVYDPNFNAF